MTESMWVAVASGVLGAGLTQLAVWVRELVSSRRSRNFAALRIALMCEHYAVDCASDIELRTGPHQEWEGSILPEGLKLPAIPDLPTDIDLKAIRVELIEPLLSLDVEIRFAESALSSEAEHLDGEDMLDAYVHAVAQRGLRAWDLGSRIRLRSGLPKPELDVGEWDFLALMRECAKE